MDRRIYLSDTNKKVGGVCGGLGEYFNMDPTLIRLIWGLGTIMSGFVPGIIAYVVAWAIIPQPPRM